MLPEIPKTISHLAPRMPLLRRRAVARSPSSISLSSVRSRPHVDTGKPSRKRPGLIFPITPTISSPRAGSCTRIGNDPEAEQGPDELPGDPLGVVHPLEHRRVLRLVPLAHAAEGRQEDPHPRPDPLHGVAMRRPHPIPIQVQRPPRLRSFVADR